MTATPLFDRPIRAAIIGAGPSGYYTAADLLKLEHPCEVSIIDRLCTPFGLVRYGVAPDHQKTKKVSAVFDRLHQNPKLHFVGNVQVGRDLSLAELQRYFDIVICCTGTESGKTLDLPGTQLANNFDAFSFVGWYNGHPDFQDLPVDLSVEEVVVIGNGNVALDIARVLTKPLDELAKTDISEKALQALSASRIKTVHVIGRRSAAQASFTQLELKELGDIDGVSVHLEPEALQLNAASQEELEQEDYLQQRRIFDLFKNFQRREAAREIHFHFLQSPVELLGETRLESVRLVKNELQGPAGRQKAVATGERAELKAGLVISAIGYHGLAIEGCPTDPNSGLIINDHGRIPELPGVYTAGWIKRGPQGLIGHNKADAADTTRSIMEDLEKIPPCPEPSDEAFEKLLSERGVQRIRYEEWQQLNQMERDAGAACGAVRRKFVDKQTVLQRLDRL